MKLTDEDIAAALCAMQMTIPFFRTEPMAMAIAHDCIKDMVSTKEQLDWLVPVACKVMTRFSLPELRGIFCSRYPPKDGLRTAAETPGFTPGEVAANAEAIYVQRENEEYEHKLAEWKREAKRLGEGPRPFEIPAAAYHSMDPLPRKPATREQPPEPSDEPVAVAPQRTLAEEEEALKQQVERSQKRTAEQSAALVEELEWQLKLAREMEKKLAQP